MAYGGNTVCGTFCAGKIYIPSLCEPYAVLWMGGGIGERCRREQGIRMVSFAWWTEFSSLNLPVVSLIVNKGLN